ncbi:trimeric intracellular cation channel family protein [Actinoplanes sp. NEAU-A12]|uniref:Trimeric intracellular cation channel family protein n=1 Tax=Actinoplanes sandaracinus TaxID=3045177 RepID=A0ABT6WQ59_9ACTN|nr:trimeric intracellular cation channel family protein [Actinoplanes sandaracinus]MDI6101826.1 trimeric intracellular cation channel family protein [Actinoplanes sandaracinus]
MSTHHAMAALELIGIFVFAISGALTAIQKGFDAVGILILAEVTALGGGVVRDVIIGDTPPAAFRDVWLLLVPVAAATVAFFAHPVVERLTFAVLLFDAAGLGLFCVTGTLKALDHGLGPVQSAVLGVTTAVGGGLLRDVIARQTPALVKVDTDLYSIPAMLGAATVTVAHRLDLPMSVAAPAAAVAVFAFRVIAMVRHWTAPQAWTRRRAGEASG